MVFPIIIGNILEWYDFALYGYFAATISKLFFPSGNQLISLIATFGVFAAGFLMRPVGAIIFGHFGDKVGRKKILATSIILMALSTTAIGLIPSYHQIGILAGILLTICRLIQGVAAGGEFPGSIVYLVEHAPAQLRGMFGSFSLLGSGIGFLSASLIGALIISLSVKTHFADVAWRLPFLFGIILGVIGLYLRLRLPESQMFLSLANNKQLLKYPLAHALRHKPLILLKAACLVFAPVIGSYLLFVYIPSYLTIYLKLPLQEALAANSAGWLVVVAIYPLAGYLSDRFGRKRMVALGTMSLVVFSYPLFLAFQQPTLKTVIIIQTIFAVIFAFSYAAIPTMLAEMFPTNIRYSAVAFPQNCAAIFGGTAPLVATYLIHVSHNLLAPSFYLITVNIFMLITLLFIKESFLDELE